MSKHTVGPWVTFIWDQTKPHLRTISAPYKAQGADHVFTAEISEADANLIAAAPEMLETLKMVQMYLTARKITSSGIKKVIAKAEGKLTF